MTSRRFALATLFLLALLAALGGAAFFVDFESPALGEELLRRANDASGMNLTTRAFRLNLSRGAELGDVRAQSRLPGVRYDLELARLRFEHAPLELLGGRLRLVRAIAKSPRVTIRVGREPAPNEAETSGAGGESPSAGPADTRGKEAASGDGAAGGSFIDLDVDLAVTELVIEDGAFLVQQRGSDLERLLLEGVDLSLGGLVYDRNAVTSLHGVTGAGRLAIRELRFSSTIVQGVRAAVRFDRGRIALDDLLLENRGRSWSGDLSLDANSLPFRYEMSIAGGPFDAAPYVESASLRFDGRGFGLESRDLSGSGTISLAGGALPDSPWVKSLEEVSGKSGLVGARYGQSELTFSLEDGVLRFEPFPLTAPGAVMTVEGTVSLGGELGLDVALEGGLYHFRGDASAPVVSRAP